jgi:hypothetical protein
MNNNGKTLLGFAFVQDPFGNGMNRITLIGAKQVYNKNGKKVSTGYGSQIMNAIYNNAKAAGRNGVMVNTAVQRARPFYFKKGYTPIPKSRHMHRLVTPKSSPVRSPASSKWKRESPNRKSPNKLSPK